MNFMNAIQTGVNKTKTFTENGAVAYATSGKKLLDFLFATTALRHAAESEIETKFEGVYYEDPDVAVKFLFWLRDCRGGNGERRIFRICYKWLCNHDPKRAMVTLPYVSEYGRWDDILPLLDSYLKGDVLALIKRQWGADCIAANNGKPATLFFKWMPSENASSPVTKKYAHTIRTSLGLSNRSYRRSLTAMRKYLDVTEVKMSAKQWGDISYEKVPSKANLVYESAFMKHDQERRIAYLTSLKNGDAKINAGTLQPHEIINKYLYEYDVNDTYEELWKALPDVTIGNTLVVRDGSGSMESRSYGTNVRPLDVATALAIYMADHNTGEWKDKFITFSSNPKVISLEGCDTLKGKIDLTMSEDECSNTNIEATMDLILRTAKANHCSQEDMPKNIVIVSDMQFDSATQQRSSYWRNKIEWDTPDQALFDEIEERYADAGYKLPRITFWNVSGNVNGTIPMQENELGVVLVSGFSIQILHMVMSSETNPYKVLMETINSERYAPIAEALKNK